MEKGLGNLKAIEYKEAAVDLCNRLNLLIDDAMTYLSPIDYYNLLCLWHDIIDTAADKVLHEDNE